MSDSMNLAVSTETNAVILAEHWHGDKTIYLAIYILAN